MRAQDRRGRAGPGPHPDWPRGNRLIAGRRSTPTPWMSLGAVACDYRCQHIRSSGVRGGPTVRRWEDEMNQQNRPIGVPGGGRTRAPARRTGSRHHGCLTRSSRHRHRSAAAAASRTNSSSWTARAPQEQVAGFRPDAHRAGRCPGPDRGHRWAAGRPESRVRRARLDAELVRRGLARSREDAAELIAAGRVTISGRTGHQVGDRGRPRRATAGRARTSPTRTGRPGVRTS